MGKAVKILRTPIPDLMVVETTPHSDARGAFARLYCEHELTECVGSRHIVQINHSKTSAAGAVRGMHFQRPPHAEVKMVRCLKGRAWDVAVDLRSRSPTFLHWHAEVLTSENARMMVIPEGFAHGFQVLEAETELLYLHTAVYTPDAEGGLRHDDPRLGIDWPLPVTDLSLRDTSFPLVDMGFDGITP